MLLMYNLHGKGLLKSFRNKSNFRDLQNIFAEVVLS